LAESHDFYLATPSQDVCRPSVCLSHAGILFSTNILLCLGNDAR